MGSNPVCALVVFHESRETLKPVARHSGMVRNGAVQQRPPFRSSPVKDRAAISAKDAPAWS